MIFNAVGDIGERFGKMPGSREGSSAWQGVMKMAGSRGGNSSWQEVMTMAGYRVSSCVW